MLSLIGGREFKRVGQGPQRGVEFHGPCPVCGGRDRFHIWPEHPQGPQWWCRQCDKGGDLVEFYRWRDGLSYRDACARAGVDARSYAPQSAPSVPRASRPRAFEPASQGQVPADWAIHAAKFARWCHANLLANPDQLAWLAGRGIDSALVAKYGLGWNPEHAYRPRESWGLPTVRKDNGQLKKLWLPLGLTIPVFAEEALVDLRIRQPEGEPRYYVVPGATKTPLVSRTDAEAYVIVESGLDAILLDGIAGDLVGVVALGNSSIKPTAELHALLNRAVHLSISLDSDPVTTNSQTGRPQAAGQRDSRWWLATYPQADRVPVIGGKDPGDAHKAGVDLRAWVLAGLPPRFHLRTGQAPVVEAPAATVKDSSAVAGSPAAEPEAPAVRILTLTDGRDIHITADEPTWRLLQAEGKIVFSENELVRIQAATATMTGEEKALFVARVVDAKEIFNGAYVRRGEVVA